MNTWKKISADSDFSIYNLPFGIFSTGRRTPRVGVALGDEIIDLAAMATIGLLDEVGIDQSVLYQNALNDFIATGKETTSAVRLSLQQMLCDENAALRDHSSLFIQQANAKMHMPVQVGDYTDFYSSIEHATNVGKMFRDPENALLPNWKHLPVGYHGRASSIVVSGTDIRRPQGQIKKGDAAPQFGPSERMDFELEMAFVIGKESTLGSSISTSDAEDHIFGMVLFNDWSARDIQKWEYVPLGPFLGKNFASSVSPWVIPLEALEPFRVDGPVQNPEVLSYLTYDGPKNYDIQLEVELRSANGSPEVITQSNFRWMYWNMVQQLAHHTVNGCNVNVGDMLASGTISGPTPGSYGSMLELSWGGKRPIQLKDGSLRNFLHDHDEIIMRGWAERNGQRVGFGAVTGTIMPPM